MASKDSKGDELNDKPDNSDESFGLPEIEYKPLDQPTQSSKPPEEVVASESSSGYSYTSTESNTDQRPPNDPGDDLDMDEPKSKAPVILGIVIVLVLAISGYLIYNFVLKPRAEKAEKARQDQLVREESLKKQKDEEARIAREAEAERKRQEDLANAKPAVGSIETLSVPTKRYYVIVASDIDDDLLMDFAKKLSVKGISTKIIPPFGEKKFYRLAITDQDTFASAQTNAEAAKADYGGAVWVMKY